MTKGLLQLVSVQGAVLASGVGFFEPSHSVSMKSGDRFRSGRIAAPAFLPAPPWRDKDDEE